MLSRGTPPAACLAAVLAVLLTSCGGGSGSKDDGSSKPPAVATPQSFPSPAGKTIAEIREGLGPGPVLAPAVSILTPGQNRFAFGLFDRARRQISQAPTALYIAPVGSDKVQGPIPAKDYALGVQKPYQSKTVFGDPNAARSVYVASPTLSKAGNYEVLGVAKLDDRLVAASPISMPVIPASKDPVPGVGDKAIKVDTPTVASVGGDVSKIDTRTPPDDMHKYSLADVLGKKPVVLVFATPALCQSRVCGPALDVAYQVEQQHPGQAVFIHQEIYNDNDPNKGFRPQVTAWHLPTEPWIFAIDRKGKIVDRIEGAATVADVEAALKAAVKR